MSTPKKLPILLAHAEYNAYATAISPIPLGDRKPSVGEWLWCPESNNIFSFTGESEDGSKSTGTIIYNMDRNSKARTEIGSEYRSESIPRSDYHPVSRAVFTKKWPKSPKDAVPALFEAIVASDITVAKLSKTVTKEVRRSPSNRSSLIEDLIVMCAKRHIGNEHRLGLDAVMCEVPAGAKAMIEKIYEPALEEWKSLIEVVEIMLNQSKSTPVSPTGVEAPVSPSGVNVSKSSPVSPTGVEELVSPSGIKVLDKQSHIHLDPVKKKLDFEHAHQLEAARSDAFWTFNTIIFAVVVIFIAIGTKITLG